MRRAVSLLAVCGLMAGACAPASADASFGVGSKAASGYTTVEIPREPTQTPTPTPVSTETPTPTATATGTPTPLPTPTDLPTATALPARERTHYNLTVTLSYAAHAVAVNEEILFSNNTGVALYDIVLAVEPDLWSGCFGLNSITQDGVAVANYSLSGQRLTIVPPQPVKPGTATLITLGYSLSLPWRASSSTFGWRTDQVNLTDWYPFVVPYQGGWVLHDPWTFGEHLVYDAADYDVFVQVDDPNVIMAASAPAGADGDPAHYRLTAARTFAISASDQFRMESTSVNGTQITTYALPGHATANRAVSVIAAKSIATYSDRFAPYPYPSLSVVEADLNDGQEFDGLVFLSSQFYSDYDSTVRNDLTTIGTHEIAHQWWFGLVGNDQAMEPWVDEALATYSEHVFYSDNYPAQVNWWWGFRVNYFSPTGYADSSLYSFGVFRPYVNAVYLNGVHFLDAVRLRMGDDAFYAALQDYAATYAHGHATGADLIAAFRRHSSANLSDIIALYLQGTY